jgi:hypothetical protein
MTVAHLILLFALLWIVTAGVAFAVHVAAWWMDR